MIAICTKKRKKSTKSAPFTVYGKIAGSEVDAVANVTVEADIEYIAIDTDTNRLVSGESTAVVFNPAAYGKYSGIVAVYNGNKLETVKTIDFEGTNYAVSIKLKNVDGKKVKVMLWSDGSNEPITKALGTEVPEAVKVLEAEEAIAVIEINLL